MRKIAALTAVLLVLALLLSACAETSAPGDNIPVAPPGASETQPPENTDPPLPVSDPSASGGEQEPEPVDDPGGAGEPDDPAPEDPNDGKNEPEGEKDPEENNEKPPEKPPEEKPNTEDPPSSVTPPPSSAQAPTIRSKPTSSSATKAGAEATISVLYSNLAAGMSWGDVWDRYVYSGSKNLGYTRSSFISEREEYLKGYGIKYKGVTVLSSEERKPGVFLVHGLLEYESDGEIITENGSDYVVFENGEYYISLSGPLLNAAYTKCISTFPNISCLDAVVCEYDNRTVVECTLYNLSETDYYMGYATGLPVTVVKGGETFTSTSSPGKISAGDYFAVTVELPGYKGMPDKLILDGVMEMLDASTGTGKAHSVDILLYY